MVIYPGGKLIGERMNLRLSPGLDYTPNLELRMREEVEVRRGKVSRTAIYREERNNTVDASI